MGVYMKTIGIVFAISKEAGELCKKKIEALAFLAGIDSINIITHENKAEKYNAAANNLGLIAELVLSSIKYLNEKGAEVVIISANSVHRAFSLIEHAASKQFPNVKLLSIVNETIDSCCKSKYKKVAIFGSNSTINSKMYHNALAKNNINVLELTKNEQSFISLLISEGISPDKIQKQEKTFAIGIAQRLAEAGCEAIILACTELSLVFDEANLGLPVIDTNAIIAASAFREALVKSNTSEDTPAEEKGCYIRCSL